jgi:hypothetical protein
MIVRASWRRFNGGFRPAAAAPDAQNPAGDMSGIEYVITGSTCHIRLLIHA